MIHEYNQHMNAVNHLDQHLSYYSFNRKTIKWWKRAATHLLHMAKTQAFILYNKIEEEKMTQLDFTLSVIDSLVNDCINQAPAPQTDVAPDDSQDENVVIGQEQQQDASLEGDENLDPTTAKKRKIIEPIDIMRLSHRDNPHVITNIEPTAKSIKPYLNCKCCTLTDGKGKYIRRQCTKYMCKACKIPLCAVPCFEIYHSSKDYKREMRRYYSIN